MDDFLLLKEVKCQQHLLHDDSHLALFQFDAFEDGVHEGALGLIFKHYADDVLVLVEAKQTEDARTLLERPVHLDFIEEEI